jgi:DNA-binding transcriptional ArsR family regulator
MANKRELTNILKALSNERRLHILEFLKKNKKPTPVYEIAKEIDLSLKATSKHLLRLRAVDILDHFQKSLNVYYFISKKQEKPTKTVISML